ncbi:MAG: hypothetical protein GY710_13675 [Desulfobacteraceae bacterium]|nr:hypothetical protein [Desulfobacteraceae bacterium]
MREPLCISSKRMLTCPPEMSVSTIQDLNLVDLEAVSFLILDLSDWQVGYQQLRRVRSHVNPDIYLKPVLFRGSSEAVPREVLQASDGIIRPDETEVEIEFSSWSARLEAINVRIDGLKKISKDGDSNIAFKVLRLIETRNKEFKPIPSARKLSGHIYPSLQPLFPKQDIGVLETLEFLENQKLITGQFVSRAYGCTHCGCAFLNFFEICPDCNSSDLYTEELIHHFRCAYVGGKSDYKQGQELICPKCDRALKHIGVDYDKASVVHHCNNCSNVFQESGVMTSCYDCWRETKPENQLIRDIQTYNITALGQNAARHGMDSLLQTILETKVYAISFDAFKNFFRLEIARIERYKVSISHLVILRLDAIDQIYSTLGKRSRQVFDELSEAFKAALRTSDLFSVRDETIFLVILTETPLDKAELAMKRLEERIIALLTANLKMECRVEREIYPIEAGIDLENKIELFLQTHAD